MSTTPEVNEIDIALSHLSKDVGAMAREKAVLAAKLATAQAHLRTLQDALEESHARVSELEEHARLLAEELAEKDPMTEHAPEAGSEPVGG